MPIEAAPDFRNQRATGQFRRCSQGAQRLLDALPDHRVPGQFKTGAQMLEFGQVSQGFEVIAMIGLAGGDRSRLDELTPL